MKKTDKIYVAGHRGLAGSALVRRLQTAGYTNLVMRTHGELELTDQAAVAQFFDSERPDHVFLAAAKVGGILANNTYRADFIYGNLAVETNVIHSAWRTGVKRLLFLGSSCIYPRDCPQPMKEEYLLTGPLEETNQPYAVAKIAGIEMCSSFNRQYQTHFLAAMPTNLFGPGDNYDLQNSHVLPALIRKFHEAKTRGEKTVTLWGTGKAKREFLYSDDMADACILLMKLPDQEFSALLDPSPAASGSARLHPIINVGYGEDITVRELAELIADIVGFSGTLAYDSSKPDGTPRKLLDVGRMHARGWRPIVDLRAGIKLAYDDFLGQIEKKGQI